MTDYLGGWSQLPGGLIYQVIRSPHLKFHCDLLIPKQRHFYEVWQRLPPRNWGKRPELWERSNSLLYIITPSICTCVLLLLDWLIYFFTFLQNVFFFNPVSAPESSLTLHESLKIWQFKHFVCFKSDLKLQFYLLCFSFSSSIPWKHNLPLPVFCTQGPTVVLSNL